MRKAIFLDRDGVINKIFIRNDLPFSPPSFDQLKILPGVKESILRLKKLNFLCLVVTNQPDVSRGKIEKKTVIKRIAKKILPKVRGAEAERLKKREMMWIPDLEGCWSAVNFELIRLLSRLQALFRSDGSHT